MASHSLLSTRRIVDRSLLTGFVEIFQTTQNDEKLRIFSLNKKPFLRRVMEADTASPEQVHGVLKTKLQRRKADRFATLSAVTDPSLICGGGVGQIRQDLRASMEMQTCAASDGRVSNCFFTLLEQKEVTAMLSNRGTFLQNFWTRRREAAKSTLLQFVPTTM